MQKIMRRSWIFAGAFLAFARVSPASVLLDDFNRPDGGVGANWTVQTGSFAIQSNQLVTTTNGSLMTFNGQTSNSATVDVFHVPPTSYDAIVLGFQDLNNNLFIKVQDNGSGSFDAAGFYFGNNGSNNASWSAANFFFLSSSSLSA